MLFCLAPLPVPFCTCNSGPYVRDTCVTKRWVNVADLRKLRRSEFQTIGTFTSHFNVTNNFKMINIRISNFILLSISYSEVVQGGGNMLGFIFALDPC